MYAILFLSIEVRGQRLALTSGLGLIEEGIDTQLDFLTPDLLHLTSTT
jgi:hypothetical protein